EVLGPYHVRVWGQFRAAPAKKAPLPCAPEELGYALTRPEPRVVSWEAAPYSEVARKVRLEGTVIVVAQVDSQGAVAWACARQRLPLALDRNSEFAVRKWRFAPDPEPVRWVEVQFDFTSNDMNGAGETDRPAE